MRRHEWISILGRAARTKRGVTARALAGLAPHIVLVAVIGPSVEPYSPTALVPAIDFWPSLPTRTCGTDDLGRHCSRVVDGGGAPGDGGQIGTLSASSSGGVRRHGRLCPRRGGHPHHARLDVVLAFPGLVFILVLVGVAGRRPGSSPWRWLRARPARGPVITLGNVDISEPELRPGSPSCQGAGWTIMAARGRPSDLAADRGVGPAPHLLDPRGRRHLASSASSSHPRRPAGGQMINENRIGISANPWAVWRLRS